jgi:hypothetical protein
MKIEIELPDDVVFLFKIYASVLDHSLPGFIEHHLTTHARDNLSDGEVIGEEIGEVYKEMTKGAETGKTA